MSSRRRSAMVVGLAVGVVAVVGIVALAAIRSGDGQDVVLAEPTPTPGATPTKADDVAGERRSPTPRASPTPSPVETTPESACKLPDLRPAVLPWLDEGEDLPEPDVVHEAEESSYLAWLGDDQASAGPDVSWEGPVVSIAVLRSPDLEPGQDDFFRQVDIRGHAGEVLWVGDPGVGELSVRWREADGECGVHSVSALTSGDWGPFLSAPVQEGERCASPSEEDFDECYEAFVEAMEEEVVRVARSLVDP